MKNVNFRFNNPIFPESGPGKHFPASVMCAIDSPHKITPRKSSKKIEKQNFQVQKIKLQPGFEPETFIIIDRRISHCAMCASGLFSLKFII
jgi:hypothetical protein